MAYRWGGPPGGSQGWGGASAGGGGETPVGLPYIFQADSQTDPASGLFDISDISPSEGDEVFLRFNSIDATTTDRESVLTTLSAGGLIYLNTAGDDTAVAVFKATYCVAATGDNGPVVGVTATYLSGVLPNDGGAVRVTIAPVEVTGVKRYVAKVNQQGTSSCTLTVIENSIGGTVTLNRSVSQGIFDLSMSAVADLDQITVVLGRIQIENQGTGTDISPVYDYSGRQVIGIDQSDGSEQDFNMAPSAFFLIEIILA